MYMRSAPILGIHFRAMLQEHAVYVIGGSDGGRRADRKPI